MNTHFEAVVGDERSGYQTIDFNGRCNYIKDMFGNFIGFFNSNENGEILLSVIHKDKITQIMNIGTEK